MDDDRRSQLVGLFGSLLVHALIVVPFLSLTTWGDAPEQRGGSREQTIVITLLPADGVAVGHSDPSPPRQSDESQPSETPPRFSGTPRPGSEASNRSSPANPIESGRAEGLAAPALASAAPAPTNEDVRAYQRALLAHIERYRGYPSDERNRRIEGTVLVRFAMTREGDVLEAWVDRSSGVMALDNEAIATVRRAQPLPMIPASLPDRLSIALPVSFRVQ